MATNIRAPNRQASTSCWRVMGLPDVVMFNGHHTHDFIPHSHDFVTVVFVTKGAYQFEIDRSSHIVEAGDLLVIGANQVHAARPVSADGWEMRSMHIPEEQCFCTTEFERRGTSGTFGFSDPIYRADRVSRSLFSDMHRCADSAGDAERQCDQIRAFLDWFNDHLDIFQPEPGQAVEADSSLEKAKNLILRGAFDSTLIDEIAEDVGMSTFSLIRRFKKSYGISPHGWRMQVRAKEAAELLRSGVGLADVAMNCGFADQAHMTRVFKRVYGVTPGQYQGR